MPTNRTLLLASAVIALGSLNVSCAGREKKDSENDPAKSAAAPSTQEQPTIAVLRPAPNAKARGTVQFVPQNEGVRVMASFEGLAPNSEHGFHIHEYGDCSDPKFQKAGDHFNPTAESHGGPDSQERHVGDFGNLISDAQGRAQFDAVIADLKSTSANVLGRAVIVHRDSDDLSTQPSGDPGERVACGVIGLARTDVSRAPASPQQQQPE